MPIALGLSDHADRVRLAVLRDRRVQLALCLAAVVLVAGSLRRPGLTLRETHATPRWAPGADYAEPALPLPAGTYSREQFAPNLLPGERYITAMPYLGFTNQARLCGSQ